MIKSILRLISAVAFAFVGLPCIVFGISGLSGTLADTSMRENVETGIWLIAIAALTLVPAILSFVPWRLDQRH